MNALSLGRGVLFFCLVSVTTAATAPRAETATITVDADTPMTTASGATYTAPKGWTAATRGDVITLQDPNREVSITFLERKETDGLAAIAAGWRQAQPDFARAVMLRPQRASR